MTKILCIAVLILALASSGALIGSAADMAGIDGSKPSGDVCDSYGGTCVIADFVASPTEGKAPLQVQFLDTSTGYPTMWAWDFGDGGAESGPAEPMYTYTKPGIYTVTLTASSQSGGISTKIRQNYIKVLDPKPLEADFLASPTNGKAPLTVEFTDCSKGAVENWSWDFGDGSVGTGQNLVHVYQNPGKYTVKLTVSSLTAGSDTKIKEQYITVEPGCNINANFRTDTSSGTVPLTVRFTDSSTGSPTMWTWDFGDGGTATIANPTHTYTNPGTYTVRLAASSQLCAAGTKECIISVNPPAIQADFSANPKYGSAPLSVQFTDSSIGNPTMWAWNFGDGMTAMVANPVHVYTKPGVYTVSLTASNQYASSTKVKKGFITVNEESISADFSGTPRSGRAPLKVQFTDRSTGFPELWAWNFGDGRADNVQNPFHTYTLPGTYPVTLTASKRSGNTDTEIKTGYITVLAGEIDAEFIGEPREGRGPLMVQFKDCSIGNPTMWAWDFGDGSSDLVANPRHTYTKPGRYSVTLTASNQYGGSDTVKKQDYIIVLSDAISADFSGSPKEGPAPLTVQFKDASTGKPTIWAWNFGNGGTAATADPVYTYKIPGCYDVTMTASDQYGGSDTVKKVCYIIVLSNIIDADFTADTTGGCNPLIVRFTDKTTGNPTMWAWDFGDGSSDMVANPVHSYSKPGSYSVTLTASNQNGGSDTVTKKSLIVVQNCNPFGADFSATPRSASAPMTVQFTDLSTGNPALWSWDFGDGGTDMVASPKHIYASEGRYTVTLTASNQKGESDTEVKVDYITVSGAPSGDTIPLSSGWNFISVNKKLAEGSNTAAVFKNVDVGGHSIFQYDATNHVWNSMEISTPVRPLDGLWIYSTKADSVPLLYDTNPVQVPPTKELKKGWNGIGFTGTAPLEAKYSLLSVEQQWINCVGYNAVTQQYDQMIIKGSNDGIMMQPYKGYWIFMSEEGVLAANGA